TNTLNSISFSILEEYDYLIEIAMGHIESRTCVRFKPRTHEKDYVLIVKDRGSCYSYVGKLPNGGMQPLSLGRGCVFLGTIIHELLHAVGFHHEHSRTDRDEYVKILWSNILPMAVKQFRIVDPLIFPQFYHFDYESIMLYGSAAFSRDGRTPTILRRKGFHRLISPVYQRSSMSEVDARRVRKLYNCEEEL
ncbi:metalloproteinase-like protein, partial [Dinothrombium tinctorium]